MNQGESLLLHDFAQEGARDVPNVQAFVWQRSIGYETSEKEDVEVLI